MDFYDMVRQVSELLQRDGRTTYRALKRQFSLDDDALADLKEELLFAHPVLDEAGKGLVWNGKPTPREPDVRSGIDTDGCFLAVLRGVMWMLQRDGRVTYRELKHVFDLDDALLGQIRKELSFRRLATDEDGEGLVWLGDLFPEPDRSMTSHGPTALSQGIATDTPQEASTTPLEPTRLASEAERRQLTVMFCDLADSTKLAQQLDPEDLREVVRAYQAAATEVIQQYDGHMAQYLGDGLLIYFGWPVAHEDDAQRALHAGLGIVAAIARLNPHLEAEKGVQLTVRLGAHTGPVVVGEMGGGGRHENLATGETVNIAARLEGLAAPNTVVISATTARLVEGAFVLDNLGPQRLKGVTDPMHVFRVDGSMTDHADETALIGAAFLVGRDEEIGLLRRRWEQSREGLGQVVLISGEAGIGKSSLISAVRQHVLRAGFTRMTFRCSPYHTNSALYPVIDHVQRVLQIRPGDTPAIRLEKLENTLRNYSRPLAEVVPLYAALLSVPLPEGRYPPLNMASQQQRQLTQDALVGWLLEEAERQPMLAMWEDLHWADPSTLEMLGLVLEQTPTVPMLHVLTFRPEFESPWPSRSHMTPITLNRLERPQVEVLIAHLAAGKTLPEDVLQHIVAKTDGVPLYVEELTKMLLASDLLREEGEQYVLAGPLSSLAIPDTLQDSLMARLDQMHTAKEVAQLGAVLGREFAYEMIEGISTQNHQTLQSGLAQLVEAELLYQRGRPPRARYIFKHALIQDAAYASLLRSTRQQVHQQIAQLLETRFSDIVQTQPELVAYHYMEAGLAEPAVAYWQQAGTIAKNRSAHAEAIHHFSQGLEALSTLPKTPAGQLLELDLRIALGPELMVAKGFAASEVEATYTRARELCQQLGETPRLFPAMWGLWLFYGVKGDHYAARDLAQQLLRLAQSFEEADLLLQAHHAMWMTLFHHGEFAAVQKHCELGNQLYDPDQHHAQTYVYGNHDPGVCARGFGCLTLWFLGYPDQARQMCDDLLTLARQLKHPFSLVQAHRWAMFLYLLRGEYALALDQAEATLSLATEQGVPFYKRQAEVGQGWLLAATGDVENGIRQLQKTLAEQAEERNMLPWSLSLMADAYGKQGRIDASLHAITTGLDALHEHEVYLWQAHVLRVKGELLLKQSPPDVAEAETCFQQALDIARQQQAKSWQLRAATSMARLWQQQGKRRAAHDLLAPVYDWFTEGFDTADLKDAKGLLQKLKE